MTEDGNQGAGSSKQMKADSLSEVVRIAEKVEKVGIQSNPKSPGP